MAFGGILSLTPPPRGLQLYSNAYVFVEGKLLAQESSVTVQKKSNATTIETLHRGFAGQSKGAGTVEVTVENAVPSTDFELLGGATADSWIMLGKPIEIGIVMGSRQMILKGVIDEATYSHSTNDPSRLSFHLIGRLEAFE